MTLVVDHLSKRFGTVVALDDLAFEVAPGQVFGFLGANGAGKTTTMRIALGVLEPDAGRITWRGPRATDCRARRGATSRRSAACTRACACWTSSCSSPASRASRGTARGETRRRWLRRFRAEDLADRRAEQLSKGNQQKIQFIAAVLHDPQVLLMDEPFTGLDPVNVMLLREAFLELRDRGRTVVFSTHQMEVAEALCESVAIVDRGRMVVGGTLREVRRATGRRMVRISVEGDHRLAWLADVPGTRIIQVGMDRQTVELEPGIEPDVVLAAAVRAGAKRHALRARRSEPRAGVRRLRRPARRRGDASRAGGRPDRTGRRPTSPPRTRRSPSRARTRHERRHDQHRPRRAPRVRRAREVPRLRVLDAAAGRARGRGGPHPARRPDARSCDGDPRRRRRSRPGARGSRGRRARQLPQRPEPGAAPRGRSSSRRPPMPRARRPRSRPASSPAPS